MKATSKTIEGRYNRAVVYTQDVDSAALEQIKRMCDYRPLADSRICIMPDVHAGAGCTIGTTMTVGARVVPSMVGQDIGCGMRVVRLVATNVDYARLDAFVRAHIPAGKGLRGEGHPYADESEIAALRCVRHVDMARVLRSMGTLGGGNHFIEVDADCAGGLYLVIHSGSRILGAQVAEYYRREAFARLAAQDPYATPQSPMAHVVLAEGEPPIVVPYDMAYLEGDLLEDYLYDMAITQRFASRNRQAIADAIVKGLDLGMEDAFETVHNYIDIAHGILRKGAVSAQKGERLLIPLNMRDGALLCVGKGNPDWNYSAPHGAGRKLSRGAAKSSLSMEEYRREMEGVYTTSVARGTLDESPMAYKSAYDILHYIRPTVAVTEHIRPTYNFKAGE